MLSKDARIINVGIAEIQIAKNPGILRTTLGSCIGIVLYQPENRIGAISHIMLSHDPVGKDKLKNPGKYAGHQVYLRGKGCKPMLQNPEYKGHQIWPGNNCTS